MTSESQSHVIDIDQAQASISSELIPPEKDQLQPQPSAKKGVSFHNGTGWQKFFSLLKNNLLTILTILGVFGGIALGLCLRIRKEPWKKREVMYVRFFGELFLRMLKGLSIPLIISSLVAAIGGLDLSLSKKIGGKAIVYYLATTAIAVLIGIIMALAIGPGIGARPLSGIELKERNEVIAPDAMMDVIRNLFPPNLIQAAMQTYETSISKPNDSGPIPPKTEWEINERFVPFPNTLGIILFSLVLGIALGQLGERGRPLLNVFISLSNAIMMITEWVAWISPVGVCFLIASELIDTNDLGSVFAQLGKYLGTVMIGLAIHALIVLPAIYTVITWTSPFRFFANSLEALFNAFGTSSSYATLPVTIKCLEEKNGIDPRVSRFVLPIGATVNMDGGALYEAVAVLWIAQMEEVPLGFGTIINVFIAAIAASIATTGIPQGGVVMMMMVLYSVGLDPELAAYILPLEWIIDRFCTSINVLSDIVGAGVVYHMTKHDLEEMDNFYATMEASSSDGARTVKSGSVESVNRQN